MALKKYKYTEAAGVALVRRLKRRLKRAAAPVVVTTGNLSEVTIEIEQRHKTDLDGAMAAEGYGPGVVVP